MRVLMIATSYPKYPGEMTAPFIEEIAVAIAERGHEVHMVLPAHTELQRQPVERGVHIHPYTYSPFKQMQVWGYASALHNDVAMKTEAFMVAPWALSASWYKLHSLLQQRQFDLIHAHWVIPNGLPAWIAAAQTRLPLVLSTHGSDISVAERTLPSALIARSLMNSARGITGPSSDLITRAAALGAPIERLHILPYCVHADEFYPDPQAGLKFRTKHTIEPTTPLLFSIGRMVEKKGFTYLIQALEQIRQHVPNVKLMLAGYGPLRDELEREAKRYGVHEHLLFPGPLHRDTINGALNAADVFVLPSVRDSSGNVDGLPNTLIEAMGAGRPIVASRIAGVPAVITSGEHGILVPPQDVKCLADALTDLLLHPTKAQALGAQARRRVEQELTWNRYAARLEQIYTQQ